MFSGIVECMGKCLSLSRQGANLKVTIESPLAKTCTQGQSLAHNGVCLTVIEKTLHTHTALAVEETLLRSNLQYLQEKDMVNLERAVCLGDRIDGHLVQGHVDEMGICTAIESKKGSWHYRFSFDPTHAQYLIEKGSICINGVSLTAYAVQPHAFSVSVIPYTHAHTNLGHIKMDDKVNLEFDMLGKYVEKILKKESQ